MSRVTRVVVVVALVLVAIGILVAKSRHKDLPPPVAGTPTTTTSTPLPRLLDLGATKCIPCKMMAPVLEELRKENAGRLQVDFIDVWENPAVGEGYGIRSIPVQIFFDASGKERFRHEGFMPKEDILAKWNELGVVLNSPAPAGASAP